MGNKNDFSSLEGVTATIFQNSFAAITKLIKYTLSLPFTSAAFLVNACGNCQAPFVWRLARMGGRIFGRSINFLIVVAFISIYTFSRKELLKSSSYYFFFASLVFLSVCLLFIARRNVRNSKLLTLEIVLAARSPRGSSNQPTPIEARTTYLA